MLKFSTTTPFSETEDPERLLNVYPLIVPPPDSKLEMGDIKGKEARIVGKALEIAGFSLPCFFDGEITELDNPNGEIIMVLPSGEYPISATLDENKDYLLDLA